ncbi:hypothetical protein F2Q70_00036031 [Brassica cretica]|uniref:Uncharacterized protein n=1 Tax=Brassica cretica TaxID=69181 RepID=A0A8S9K0U3_BRACR|nr:hypothetical protein F2Q70_00036031 [Brassica cretica]
MAASISTRLIRTVGSFAAVGRSSMNASENFLSSPPCNLKVDVYITSIAYKASPNRNGADEVGKDSTSNFFFELSEVSSRIARAISYVGDNTTRKQRHTEGKKRRYVVGNALPTTYRRNKSSEITPRKFIFPRKSLGVFRRNSEETNFRGNSEDHQFVGKLLGIYRGRTSSESTSEVPTKCSSEFSSGISDEMNPRKIPRNKSLGIFRGMSPSVYSEEHVPRYEFSMSSIHVNHGSVNLQSGVMSSLIRHSLLRLRRQSSIIVAPLTDGSRWGWGRLYKQFFLELSEVSSRIARAISFALSFEHNRWLGVRDKSYTPKLEVFRYVGDKDCRRDL